MSQPAESYDVTSLSDAALSTLLHRLAGEERLISMQRQRLHERIDGGTPQCASQLPQLRREERALSDRRLELHRQINELRIERSRRIARSHLSPVE